MTETPADIGIGNAMDALDQWDGEAGSVSHHFGSYADNAWDTAAGRNHDDERGQSAAWAFHDWLLNNAPALVTNNL